MKGEDAIKRYLRDRSTLNSMSDKEKKLMKQLDKVITLDNQLELTVSFMEHLCRGRFEYKLFNGLSDRNLRNCLPHQLPYLRKQILAKFSPLILSKMLDKALDGLPKGEQINVTVRRRRAFDFVESGQCDHDGTQTVFGQLMQDIKKKPTNINCFRINSLTKSLSRNSPFVLRRRVKLSPTIFTS